jgi:cholesterol oxidase
MNAMAEMLEAVVIGSGFGGSISACRLGKRWPGKVLLLERGKRYRLGEFPRSPHDFSRNFWAISDERTKRPRRIRDAKKKAGRDLHGMYDVRTYDKMDVVVGAGLGGGSLIYANVFMVPPDQVFADERWPATCQKACLQPYYAVAREVLGSRPVPLDGDSRRHLLKTEVYQDVARKLNRESQLVDINVFFGRDSAGPALDVGVQQENRYGAVQTSCTYCGECIVGCNYHAKNTLDLNYLHVAERVHGVAMRTECLVDEIAPLNAEGIADSASDGTHGYRVSYRSLDDGERHVVETQRVVVSAGAMSSTELLLRMKRQHLPNISDQLGKGFSGNGDFLSFLLKGPHTDPNRGPTITQRIDFNLFHEFAPKHAFLLEDASYPPFLAWFVEGSKPRLWWLAPIVHFVEHIWENLTTGKSPGSVGFAFADLIKRTLSHDSAVLLCMGLDSSTGVMSLNDRGEFTLSWPQQDNKELYDSILAAGRDFTAALGWREFIPLPTWNWPIRNNITVHPLGGCVLADTPQKGVTSADRRNFGEVFGYRGLYVADGGILPTAVGANPSATICALCEMVAQSMTGIAPDATLV